MMLANTSPIWPKPSGSSRLVSSDNLNDHAAEDSCRPHSAARARASFTALSCLHDFPLNWYESPRAVPPTNVHYDVEAAANEHRRTRASTWLLLLWLGENVTIPTTELDTVRLQASPHLPPAIALGPVFLGSSAGTYYHLSEIQRMQAALAVGTKLGLKEENISKTEKAIAKHESLLRANPNPQCAEAVALTDRMAQRRQAVANQKQERPQVDSTKAERGPDTAAGGLDSATHDCPSSPCPNSAPVYIEERQIVITQQVKFATDSDKLLDESHAILDGVAALLKQYPQLKKIRIDGHTDARGTPDHNLELSRQRAVAVRGYLASKGVDPNRLETAGFGSRIPIAFGQDESAWRINRRVEFIILDADPIRTVTAVAEDPRLRASTGLEDTNAQ